MKLRIQINANQSNSVERVEVELTKKGLLIGRRKADVVIPDVKCSQRHAAILVDAEKRVWIKDLESTNGIKVNGKKVEKAELLPKTLIKIGSTLLFVEFIDSVEVLGRAPLKEDVIHNWPLMFQAVRKKKEFSSYL